MREGVSWKEGRANDGLAGASPMKMARETTTIGKERKRKRKEGDRGRF